MEVTVPDGCIPGDTMAVQSASRWQLDGCTSGMWSIHTVNPSKNREGRRTLARWLSTWVDRVDIELRSDDGRDRDGWPVTVPDGMLSGEMFNDSRGSDS